MASLREVIAPAVAEPNPKSQAYVAAVILRDRAVLAEASTLGDHLIEWRSGNDVGYGIMEYGSGPEYYRYKEIQHLPTF